MATIVELISIGDEVLTGHTLDTNAQFIARALLDIGCDLKWRVTVGDDITDIKSALSTALYRADVVITTGGLGPTHDDRTKEALCQHFELPLIHNPDILAEILRRYEARGMSMTKSNENQTMLPQGARLFPNPLGSAVGICIEKNGRAVISLPGVPKEMMTLISESVIPFIREHFSPGVVVVRKLRTTGITESKLSELLDGMLDLSENISMAYLPSYGGVDLRFIARGNDRGLLTNEIEKIEESICSVAGEYLFGVNEETLESVVGSLLLARTTTLAVAESCTGGMLGGLLTNVPGSSAFFMGGVISYNNSVKMRELGVSREMLDAHGAVSTECAEAMAAGVRSRFNTTYALSVTGIAGPDGGTKEKPVGLVWLGFATPDKVITTSFKLSGDRQIIRTRATYIALDLLRRELLGLPTNHKL